ncbi:MFS general substrate transporter [Xylariaceae sp. FL1272]|nr:MFS general substrate transporter [Xylariaceae sp. FL1272]
MATALFQSLVEIESTPDSLPQAPQRAISRKYPAVPQEDDPLELRNLGTGPVSTAPTTPAEERDLEMSRPGTPAEPAVAFEVLPSLTSPPMNKFRLMAVCLFTLLGGITDSAPGALIPYMETYYNIGYAIVSLIFVGNAFGFILAAPFVDAIREGLGRGKTLCICTLLMVLGYLPLAVAAPFPALVVGYFFIGFGFSNILAICNVFTANLQNGTTLLGIMHGSYGVGGVIGPLIATKIVASMGENAWNRFFFINVSLGVSLSAFFAWSFWNYEKEAAAAETASLMTMTRTASTAAAAPRAELSAMMHAFKSRVVILGATFIFAYQGAEVSISGWVISFLIATRNGNPSAVGNVTAGFWGGITLGRFILAPVGARVGEKRFVYYIVVGAGVFQLLVWLVPNIIGEAVSLAIVGLLLGPVYPCAATIFTRNMSRRQQGAGFGVISAFGSSGGAVAPFTTGILAQAAGTFVLHPIAIGLFVAMLVCWYIMPTPHKRDE